MVDVFHDILELLALLRDEPTASTDTEAKDKTAEPVDATHKASEERMSEEDNKEQRALKYRIASNASIARTSFFCFLTETVLFILTRWLGVPLGLEILFAGLMVVTLAITLVTFINMQIYEKRLKHVREFRKAVKVKVVKCEDPRVNSLTVVSTGRSGYSRSDEADRTASEAFVDYIDEHGDTIVDCVYAVLIIATMVGTCLLCVLYKGLGLSVSTLIGVLFGTMMAFGLYLPIAISVKRQIRGYVKRKLSEKEEGGKVTVNIKQTVMVVLGVLLGTVAVIFGARLLPAVLGALVSARFIVVGAIFFGIGYYIVSSISIMRKTKAENRKAREEAEAQEAKKDLSEEEKKLDVVTAMLERCGKEMKRIQKEGGSVYMEKVGRDIADTVASIEERKERVSSINASKKHRGLLVEARKTLVDVEVDVCKYIDITIVNRAVCWNVNESNNKEFSATYDKHLNAIREAQAKVKSIIDSCDKMINDLLEVISGDYDPDSETYVEVMRRVINVSETSHDFLAID